MRESRRPAVMAIAWSGLPWYAARLIRNGVTKINTKTEVLGTAPEVPMGGVESILGRKVQWLDKQRQYKWGDLFLETPSLFIHTGWNIPCFNSLAVEVRATGGAVVSMIDNCYKRTLRQRLGAWVFRMHFRKRWDAVWVPGSSGKRLLVSFGMPEESIYQGLYGADPNVFGGGSMISTRKKGILFVGQFIKRKGIAVLLEGFRLSKLGEDGWRLKVVGQGPEAPSVRPGEPIDVEGFKPEGTISEYMRDARICVLPSYEDHWGMVMAEAGLSGCILVASDKVGAAADLISIRNGRCFKAGSAFELASVLRIVAGWDVPTSNEAGFESRRLAECFGPDRWGTELKAIMERFM